MGLPSALLLSRSAMSAAEDRGFAIAAHVIALVELAALLALVGFALLRSE